MLKFIGDVANWLLQEPTEVTIARLKNKHDLEILKLKNQHDLEILKLKYQHDHAQTQYKQEVLKLKLQFDAVNKRRHDISPLRSARAEAQILSTEGVRNSAQFAREIRHLGLLSPWINSYEDQLFCEWETIVFDQAIDYPRNVGEKRDVQPFFDMILKKLCTENGVAYTMFEDATKSPTIGTRKPDVVFQSPGVSGAGGIVILGDTIGQRSDGEFSNADVAQILDMARCLLKEFQIHRRKIFCYLSDGWRYQFFDVRRKGTDGFQYGMSRIYEQEHGLKRLVHLLKSSPEALGYTFVELPGYQMLQFLGRGGQTVAVYSARRHEAGAEETAGATPDSPNVDTTYVVKQFESDYTRHIEWEALHKLQTAGAQNVPRPIESRNVRGIPFLVYSPVGIPVDPTSIEHQLSGSHFAQLVSLVQSAHERAHLYHRDIKPSNIFWVGDSLMLNDWASSISTDLVEAQDVVPWEGTRIYHAPYDQKPSVATDLVALVRTAFVLIFNRPPPVMVDEEEIIEWWETIFFRNERWKTALKYAKAGQYTELRDFFESL